MEILQPPTWAKPVGYANGIAAEGRLVFLAGQIGWDEDQTFASDDFVMQAKQALRNIVAILGEASGRPEHIVRLTWFVTGKDDYLGSQKQLGRAYREIMGSHYPVMSLLVIAALVEERAKVKIEATAVIPT